MNCKSIIPAVLLCLAGCGAPHPGPQADPNRSEYFSIVGEPYVIKGEEPHYALTLAFSKPVNGDKPWYALVDYENPSNATAHTIASEEVAAGLREVALLPPALPSLHNNSKYAIHITAYADADLKHPITTQVVRFTVAVLDPISSMRISEGRPRNIGHPTTNRD